MPPPSSMCTPRSAGFTRFEGGRSELHFSDSFRYEPAAYRVDRMLGLAMVPPAVLRSIDGQDGSLVWWVDGAKGAHDYLAGREQAPDPEAFERQHDLRRLFDALIGNADRNQGNMLIGRDDWKLHLIDHTRAFRYEKELPTPFLERVARLPRPIFDRLRALDEDQLRDGLEGLVDRHQLRAVLARRDRIIEKIEADRAEHGDERVFGGAGAH